MKRPAHPTFIPACPWLSLNDAPAAVWPVSVAANGRAAAPGPRCVDIGNRLPASVACSVVIGGDSVSRDGHWSACVPHLTCSDQPDAEGGNSIVEAGRRAMEFGASLVGGVSASVKVAGGSSQIARHSMRAGNDAASHGDNVIDPVGFEMEAAAGSADPDTVLAHTGGDWVGSGRCLANVGNRSLETRPHNVTLGYHSLADDPCSMASVGDFAVSGSHLMEIGDFEGEGCLRRLPLGRLQPQSSGARFLASRHFPPLGGHSFPCLRTEFHQHKNNQPKES